MFCLTCGGEISPGSKFCTRCGAEVNYIQRPVNGPQPSNDSQPTVTSPSPIPGKPGLEKPDLGGPDTSAIIAAYRNQTNTQTVVGGKVSSATKELFYAYAEKNGEELYRKCYESGKISFAALFLGPIIFIYRRNYSGFLVTWIMMIIVTKIAPFYLSLLVNVACGLLYFPMIKTKFESTLQAIKQQNPNVTTAELVTAIQGKGRPNILVICIVLGLGFLLIVIGIFLFPRLIPRL